MNKITNFIMGNLHNLICGKLSSIYRFILGDPSLHSNGLSLRKPKLMYYLFLTLFIVNLHLFNYRRCHQPERINVIGILF